MLDTSDHALREGFRLCSEAGPLQLRHETHEIKHCLLCCCVINLDRLECLTRSIDTALLTVQLITKDKTIVPLFTVSLYRRYNALCMSSCHLSMPVISLIIDRPSSHLATSAMSRTSTRILTSKPAKGSSPRTIYLHHHPIATSTPIHISRLRPTPSSRKSSMSLPLGSGH